MELAKRLQSAPIMRHFLVLLCLVVVVFSAAAQTANVTLNGEVLDQSGSALPGATVTATNTQTGLQKSSTTQDDGRYTILNLPPGLYDVQVMHPGFATVVRRNQELLVGTTVSTDFSLHVSSTTQTVVVQGESTEMQTSQATVSTILETNEIDSLPVLNRQFAALAVMTPGVQSSGVSYAGTTAATSASISIGNAPVYQTTYLVDGLTNTTGNQGGPYVQLAQDWVQEFSVLNLQYPAEYGSAAGGVVNVISRSGGNKIHGRAYAFYQNAALNSNPEFYTASAKAPFSAERVGGEIGGPIKKDKLFYFAGFEYFHQYVTNTLSAQATAGQFATTAQPIGTPAASLVPWLIYGTQTTAQVSSDSRLAELKLDYTPNSTNSFSMRTNLEYEYANPNGFGGATTLGASTNQFTPSYAATVSWTRTISSSKVNELQFGYFSRVTVPIPYYWTAKGFYTGVTPNANPYSYVTTASLGGQTVLGNPTGNWAIENYNGVTTGGTTTGGYTTSDAAGVLSDTYTVVRGNHTVKVGGDVRRYIVINTNGHNGNDGTYQFATSAGPFNPNTPIVQTYTAAGYSAASKLAPTSYKVAYGPPNLLSFVMNSYAFGFFAQDSWKVNQDLTLNLGLRYDFNNTNSALATDSFPALSAALPGSMGFIKPGFNRINNDPYVISPRFGVAWTPFHDSQRTVVRGGFGIFYDQNDTAVQAVYITGNSRNTVGYNIASNVATANPYCSQTTACNGSIPAQYEIAVEDVLASALANYTLPQFPNAGSPCAATNSCTVAVGPNTYTIPALSVSANPQGNLLDVSPNLQNAGVAQMTVGIERQFTDSLYISADYVHLRAFNGVVSINNNIALTGTGASQTYTEINPAYGTGNFIESDAFMAANFLQVKATYRDHRADSVQVAYQFGYANDDSVSNFGLSAHNTLTTDPFNPMVDYGPSSTDARNILNVTNNVFIHWGINLSPVVAFTSALPYTATSTVQAPGSALAPPGCEAYFTKCYPAGYSRNSLRGDSFFSLNARLSKNIKLGESRSVALFFEGYNLTNKFNLSTNFNTNVDNAATFRTPSGTSLPLRQFQLGGRFDF